MKTIYAIVLSAIFVFSSVGQAFGDCASEKGRCIGSCGGSGECIAYCVQAHSRCVGNGTIRRQDIEQCKDNCGSEKGRCIALNSGSGESIAYCVQAHSRCDSYCN